MVSQAAPARPVRIDQRIADLVARRVPFVHVTVVRSQPPSSAKTGDEAIVLPTGDIEGFVGGQCTVESVRTTALSAIRQGEGVLLRVLPGDAEAFPESPGAVTVVNPCLSGGAMELFLQPQLPSPKLRLVGATPIADAVAGLADTLGFAVSRTDRSDPDVDTVPGDAIACVVSTHGDEYGLVRAALDAQIPFIALVASPKRGAELLTSLDVSADERARIHTPAGLWIGARTAPEIALSILAQIVKAIRLEGLTVPQAGALQDSQPAEATDPVCGMRVMIRAETPHLTAGGTDYWFCSAGCRDTYAKAAS